MLIMYYYLFNFFFLELVIKIVNFGGGIIIKDNVIINIFVEFLGYLRIYIVRFMIY